MERSPSIARRTAVAFTLALAAGLTLDCGASDEESGTGGSSPKGPYGPPSKETVNEYQRKKSDGTMLVAQSAVVGDKDLGGKSYWRARIGAFSGSAPSGMEAWLTQPDPDTVVLAGGEFYSQTILPNPDPTQPSAGFELGAPITVDLTPPVGQAVPIALTTTVKVLGQELSVDVAGSYTLVSDDEVVTTLAGVLHGCRKYTGSGAVTNSTLATLLGANEASGEVWYHPSLGVVKASIQAPGKGSYDFDFLGTKELGKATSGTNMIQGMRVLSTLESFDLNTYDVAGQFDADKNTHAKMMIEARFVDESKAQTSNKPPIETEIGTVMGIYPHELVASPVSFFHPEENGLGMTFWIGYVDQAAKNEPQNGIAYHVKATVPDYGSSQVRVTSRIVYRVVSP